MSTPKLVLTIIQIMIGAVLCAVVLLQSGKTAGIAGAIGGGSDTFLSKNKSKSWDSKLAKWTKWIALVFMVLTLAISLL
ncbi:putative protein-export membrane protein SecG [bioreactor metagenome]|uniref:Protein-export membrane protein SecG n=1 Tax=bioreactor metagenome TaxID=1076179 RepID=A0A645IUP6_9ZZZZ